MEHWSSKDLPKDIEGYFFLESKCISVQGLFGGFIDIFDEIQQVISISQIPAKPEKQSQGEMFQVLQSASFRSILASVAIFSLLFQAHTFHPVNFGCYIWRWSIDQMR